MKPNNLFQARNIFRKPLPLFIIMVLILSFFVFQTEKTGQLYRNNASEMAQLVKVNEQNQLFKQKKVPVEGKFVKAVNSNIGMQYTLEIPGRTMQSVVFKPENSAQLDISGATLYLQPGVLKRTTELSITGLLNEDLPPIPAEIINVTKNFPGYRFLPHRTLFDSAVTLAIAYDTTLIPEGFMSDDIYTFYFDESENKWEVLERDSIDQQNSLVVSNTFHFTDMINGIIRVPESPETNGYTPTTMKDIKVADPGSGITLIEPPVANNDGDASITFPFKLPVGRVNMQPKLSLNYSSDEGSSWVGFGWNIPVPGISVDVTWGVPRYLPGQESETYLLEGIELTPLVHRSALLDRTAEKQFYPRVNVEFKKIIRHGNSPSSYWWEVTEKDGIRSFYGGTPETGVIENTVAKGENDSIGFWALTQTRDNHGNFISYVYQKPEGCGEQLYISEIRYTGHEGENGPYKVTFLTDDPEDTFVRNDGRIHANFGFLQRDTKLLRRINITYNNDTIRSYVLRYKTGAFNKTLLDSISELDDSGKVFYTHRFEYFDNVQFCNNYKPYKEEHSWSLEPDNVDVPFINPLKYLYGKVTALESSSSAGLGTKITLTGGWNDGNLGSKSMTAGGSFIFNYAIGYGQVSLMDINGDELPDKVFRKENKIYFRPNLSAVTPSQLFGNWQEISTLDEISYSKSLSLGGGVEANAFLFVGYDHIKNTTTLTNYFTDFNADGLPDMAKDNQVYFNHIGKNGIPVFTLASDSTPNPLKVNSEIDINLLPNTEEEQAENIASSPLHDAVRMWQAPYCGTVVLYAPVCLLSDTIAESMEDTLKDGVTVRVQLNNHDLRSIDIGANDFSLHNIIRDTISVQKNDRFYFRVQSKFNGHGDIVNWDPQIDYIQFADTNMDENWKDVNRKKISHFKSSEDFVLCSPQEVTLLRRGELSIKNLFSKPSTTDSIQMQIVKEDTLHNRVLLYTGNYPCDSIVSNQSIPINWDVSEKDKIFCKLISGSNVDWSKIKWDISGSYITIEDTIPGVDENGKPFFEFNLAPEFVQMYNDPIKHVKPLLVDSLFILSFCSKKVDSLQYPVSMIPDTTNLYLYTDTVLFTLKTPNNIIAKHTYRFLNGMLENLDTIRANITYGDSIYFEFNSKTRPISPEIVNLKMHLIKDTSLVLIKPDTLNPFYANINCTILPDYLIFGSLYRGWGQFDYKGEGDLGVNPINEIALKLPDKNSFDKVDDVKDTTQMGSLFNPTSEIFSYAFPYSKIMAYKGMGNLVYIAADKMSSSRLGLQNVYIPPYKFSNSIGGLPCISKVIVEKINNVTAGGAAFGANASASLSMCNASFTTDMADMNGDHYPDQISESSIKFTNMMGGIEGTSIEHNINTHIASAYAIGGSFGGDSHLAQNINSLYNKVFSSSRKGNQKTAQSSVNSKNAENAADKSIGIGGSLSYNNDTINETWMDINGDGLPDKIYNSGKVRLNLGYSFAPVENWHFTDIRIGKSHDIGVGPNLGYSYDNGSFAAGLGVSWTNNETTKAFMDVNGDGLPDIVSNNTVRFNTGTGFLNAVNWEGYGPIDAGESFGESANVAFTLGIPIIWVKICFNPSVSGGMGLSKSKTQLADMDGDGWPDILTSNSEGELKIKYSTIATTNFLKKVHNPLKGEITLGYISLPATYSHPGGKWALDTVVVYDGLIGDGVDSTMFTFNYYNGYYDRHERRFYGFDTVITNHHSTDSANKIYRKLVQVYNNKDYYEKGLMISETLTDAEDHKLTGLQNQYSFLDVRSGNILYPDFASNDTIPMGVLLSEKLHHEYEGSQSPVLTTRETYEYDRWGNIIKYVNYSTGNDRDKLTVDIQYHDNPDKYYHSTPYKQEIKTIDGLVRKYETEVNDFNDITMITQYLSAGEIALYDMEFDEYGNLKQLNYPANYKNERMQYLYEYDPIQHMFVNKITDTFGYTSFSTYNYKWGMPEETIDINGEKMQFQYDHCGRLKIVKGPYEIALNLPYALEFNYFNMAEIPYAKTKHYCKITNSDIKTYTFSDGLNRIVQIKKTGELFKDSASIDDTGFIVSGTTIFDAFGREIKQYQPIFEPVGSDSVFNPGIDNVAPTIKNYDVRNRVLQEILPDNSITSYKYKIDLFNGDKAYISNITDALGRVSELYLNPKGKQIARIFKMDGTDITTKYIYNALGELINIIDPKEYETRLKYDMAGRCISIVQPDAGLTEYKYDNAGNLREKITANLRKQIPNGGKILYNYDINRLSEIVYPKNIQNRVQYSYGAPTDSFGRAGRITLIQDASGGQEFFYGRLGEIIKTIRTVQIGESDMRTWIWTAQYDSWGRILNMTYPDGELLNYFYNNAGNLIGMHGEKLGRNYNYISRIGYNKLDKQTYLKLGNGTVTQYTYEPERQRLAQMSLASNSNQFFNNEYTYNPVNNITGIINHIQPVGDIGGKTSYNYSYDELYRLINAAGSYEGTKNKKSDYSLSLQYDIMGNIIHKTQALKKDNKLQTASTYDLVYKYSNSKPNSASCIGEREYAYDENGNQINWEDTVTNDYRQLLWDEENHLKIISDNGYINSYVYDATGERVIKSSGGLQGVYINGAPAGIVNHSDNNYTVYVSPYFVFQNNKFTKHYYSGSTRIASKIGNGQFNNLYRPAIFELTAGKVNYINRQQQIAIKKEDYYKQLGIPPGPPTMKGIYGEPEFTGNSLPDGGNPSTSVPRGWPKKPVFAPAGGPPGAPVQWGNEITNETVEAGFGFSGTGNVKEVLQYFYHPDYQGSTNYITDINGEAVQFLAYLPSGEIFVDEHTNWNSPYKFNAREFDTETGLYYSGSRYYDPKSSLWLEIDPKAESFPFLSPYIYSSDNQEVYANTDGIMGSGFSDNKLSTIISDKTINLNFGYGNYSSISANAASSPDVTDIYDWFTNDERKLYVNKLHFSRAVDQHKNLKIESNKLKDKLKSQTERLNNLEKDDPNNENEISKLKVNINKSTSELRKKNMEVKKIYDKAFKYGKNVQFYLKKIDENKNKALNTPAKNLPGKNVKRDK